MSDWGRGLEAATLLTSLEKIINSLKINFSSTVQTLLLDYCNPPFKNMDPALPDLQTVILSIVVVIKSLPRTYTSDVTLPSSQVIKYLVKFKVFREYLNLCLAFRNTATIKGTSC